MSEPAWTLSKLAAALGAELEPETAGERILTGVAGVPTATRASLLFAQDARSLEAAVRTEAGAVLTTRRLAQGEHGLALLFVADPRLAFARAAALFRGDAQGPGGIHERACVADSAELASDVEVGPFAAVGEGVRVGAGSRIGAGAVLGPGCVLGPDCRIYPRAVLYPGVELGSRVVVHAGAVLGSDGFGFVWDAQVNEYVPFPQQGRLVIEDDVEIGANTTIDRGALGETRIGRGTKLDNLVHIGHNVDIGSHVVIAAQTGISGSSRVGEGAVIAGQVGIADHVTIGGRVILGAQCGVPSSKRLEGPGVLFWGTPARPITQYLKELAALARLVRLKGAASRRDTASGDADFNDAASSPEGQ